MPACLRCHESITQCLSAELLQLSCSHKRNRRARQRSTIPDRQLGMNESSGSRQYTGDSRIAERHSL
jgi:hypothetical protein